MLDSGLSYATLKVVGYDTPDSFLNDLRLLKRRLRKPLRLRRDPGEVPPLTIIPIQHSRVCCYSALFNFSWCIVEES